MSKHTPGPLSVVQVEKFPFEILVVDSKGNEVSREHRYAYSSKSETVKDVMNGHGFKRDQRDAAIAGNERQIADAYLRAAAPDLLEALVSIVDEGLSTSRLTKARSAIAKATGGQS